MSAPLSETAHVGLPLGTIVGNKFRIDGFLGAGGMGVVLSATHLELDAPVAIKIVRDDLAQNEEVVSRLLVEARAAARMRSKHIVRVLDASRLATGAPYIVMEQLRGSDLQATLAERGALSVRDAVSYVLQACEGLAEAHGLGIIHRDLKPENLFLAATPEGIVLKILDFGISKDIGTSLQSGNRSTLTKAGAAVGSPYYMSPEQMRASPNLDARADIWSLGAILFELLTGRCPFEAETLALLCANVLVEEAPSVLRFSSTAPAQLAAIVGRCLQKEPAARFQTVTALADALRDFVAAEELAPVESPRLASGVDLIRDSAPSGWHASPPVAGEAQRPRAKKRPLLAVLASSALLVTAALIFWRLQSHPIDLQWSATTRAVAAEPSTQAPPDAAKTPAWDPDPESPPAPPTSVVVSPLTNRLSSAAPARAAAPRAIATSAAGAPRAVQGLSHAPPPARDRAAPTSAADPASVGSRYGL